MIENKTQYRVTKKAAQDFRDAIAKLESDPEAASNFFYTVQLDAYRAQLKDLEEEIRDYES